MAIWIACCLFIFCSLSYSLLAFRHNFQRVKHLDVPKVFNPLCPSNIVWLLTQPVILPIIRALPFNPGRWVRYSKWGWEYEEGYRTHGELGDVWMQVTPSMNWLYVADPVLVNEIFHRREDFRRPGQLYTMLDIFGPNIGTVAGHDWQRHKKITGAAFNEHNYVAVWNESLRQADGMLRWWLSKAQTPKNTTAQDVRALSLNVLAFVGFRKVYPFNGKAKEGHEKTAFSFRQTLCFVLDNALLTMLVPARFLRLRFLPLKWRNVGKAIEALRSDMEVLYAEEEVKSAENCQGPASLMRLMVQASKQANHEAKVSKTGHRITHLAPKAMGLTKDEIFGNIFVYYFAGHDTTAAVFAYTIYLLAAHPEVQDWITEEIHDVLSGDDCSQWSYEENFPRLKRCLAVLLETIRLYDPIPGLPKWTGDSERIIQYGKKTLVIPSGTFVLPSLMAMHTHPRYWGPDALSWRPQRWIVTDDNPSEAGLGSERLYTPVPGTYFPWSDGQRACPGKKFAQVEFVAVLAHLFNRHKVLPEGMVGETEEQARQRILDTVNDSAVKMLLQMKHPERVAVRWVESQP